MTTGTTDRGDQEGMPDHQGHDSNPTPETKPAYDLSRPGWLTAMDHGHGIQSLHYPDGGVGIRHLCIPRGSEGRRYHHAPMLQLTGGHTITQHQPLTVTPSVLCHECGLHGFIQQGTWIPA